MSAALKLSKQFVLMLLLRISGAMYRLVPTLVLGETSSHSVWLLYLTARPKSAMAAVPSFFMRIFLNKPSQLLWAAPCSGKLT